MKKITIYFLLIFLTFHISAGNLVLIHTSDLQETRSLFKNPGVTVHFYNDNFVIATTDNEPRQDIVILDRQPWQNDASYYIVHIDKFADKDDWILQNSAGADILFDGDHYLIVRTDETRFGQLTPAKNDGMVRIFEREALLPLERSLPVPAKSEPDTFVVYLLNQVNGDFITNRVQHLEDYGTRNAYAPESILAQQWIEEKFLEWGLDVEVMNFTMPGGPASDNVIATLTGTKYPDEFVVVGGHYDSYAGSGMAPGADDNASGTSGVMEIARILSQYEFDRSVIFCAFSGEEYGLYGSAAYASRSAQQGMDILGYFNMDMIGYLDPGSLGMKTSLIYPQSAQELADFYAYVTSIYLPSFQVESATLIGGDSDHTSFNNNGYMGIFPFEDVNNYSPYIHTSSDLVGPSYNNELLAVTFTKAAMASIVTMANMLNPPRNLVAIPGDGKVTLNWDEMEDIDNFKVYRDGNFISDAITSNYTDHDVVNGTQYEYYVTAIYSDSGEESEPSNRAYATPMPPIEFPLLIDFENGAPYWDLDEKWGLTTTHSYSPSHSLTESPAGQYENNRQDYATLSPLNLMGYTDATLSFYTRYDIENNWDFMYLEISTNGVNWTTLDTFTGSQTSWTQKTYSLNNFINQPYVVIRFHFYSDYSITRDGMYIDDFQITVEGGYDTHHVDIPAGWSGISSSIAPGQAQVADVMDPIFSDLIILQNMDGAYWPGQNVNTLGTWNSHSGYKIKVSEDVILPVRGFFEENKTLELSAGWNLIPVLSNCPVDIAELFTETQDDIVLVKEIAGDRLYWPEMQIQSLDEFHPGKAYLVKTGASVSFTYPECTDTKQQATQTDQPASPWETTVPTGNSHVVAFPASVLEDFEPGDFIGAFTPEGLCAGYMNIAPYEANQTMVVFANDSLTSTQDGFLQGQIIKFRLFSLSEVKEFDLVATFDESYPDAGTFAFEGISVLNNLKVDNTGIGEQQNFTRIFPNPAQDRISISIKDNEEALLTVSGISGKSYLTMNIASKEIINLSDFTPGIYIFRLMGKGFTEVHKVVIR
jgi:hypothetical protein